MSCRRDWPAESQKDPLCGLFCQYRYRDSNPGFRRERATWRSRAFPEIPSEQAKRKTWGTSGSDNRTGDVRFEFGRAAAGLLIAGLLITGSLTLAAPAQARTDAFQIGTAAETERIPGTGEKLALERVCVDGRPIVLTDGHATMYGDGVAIKFEQRGHDFYARAVALGGDPTVALIYRLW